MRENRMWRTCPTWCWVVRWRWKDPPRSACCPLSEWLFLRSEGFGSRQLRLLRVPLGSRRQRPFPRLPSFWRCLRCWTGCCCDCSPPRCCSSRWVKLSVAGGYWAWMMGRHLSPGLETGRETSYSGFTPIWALKHLDMGEATFAVWLKKTAKLTPMIPKYSPHIYRRYAGGWARWHSEYRGWAGLPSHARSLWNDRWNGGGRASAHSLRWHHAGSSSSVRPPHEMLGPGCCFSKQKAERSSVSMGQWTVLFYSFDTATQISAGNLQMLAH